MTIINPAAEWLAGGGKAMGRIIPRILCCLVAALFLASGCTGPAAERQPPPEETAAAAIETEPTAAPELPEDRSPESLQALAQAYEQEAPSQWGLEFEGILSRFEPAGKQLALTLDACGGPTGGGIDMALIDFLSREKIPATLFVSGRWAEQNRELLKELSENPLFSIQNHGGLHRPLAVTPREAYGIPAVGSVEGVMEEILAGERAITEITGVRPRFFRSGTAHYDDVSVGMLRELGYTVAGFSVNGDGGATFTAAQVGAALRACRPGDIILCHMNRPDRPTGEALMSALPALAAQGYAFVRLEDVPPF